MNDKPATSGDASDKKSEGKSKDAADTQADDPERPAQQFEDKMLDEDGNVQLTVNVDAPAGAFEPDTTMQVEWVQPEDIEQAVDKAVAKKTDGKVTDIQAVDITFYNADGEEVEPATDITVKFASDLIADNDKPLIVHVDDKGKAKVVDTLTKKELKQRGEKAAEDELFFDAGEFSTYGIVVTSLKQTLEASDGNTYTVTVDATAAAGIPQGAELQVEEVTEPGDDYASYSDQASEALGVDELSFARFFDISIVKDGQKIQPAEPVEVQIALSDAGSIEGGVKAIHFGDDGLEVLPATFKGETVSFDAKSFSVYAVVGDGDQGDYARMTLHFMNGATEIAKVYVKNSDSLEDLNTIIYDPGVGEIPTGTIFKGWSTKQNYTVADAEDGMTIEGVRDWASKRTITENEDVYLYAMLYKNYVINYLDENRVGVGSENVFLLSNETNANYTVNMVYTPKDDTHNFAGWNVSDGGTNIEGHTDGKLYENGTQITISGNVTFSVNAPEGHWLVFDENGKGATYNAPVFVESASTTQEPAAPTRFGYTFGGWYTKTTGTVDDNGYTPVDESSKFTFGDTISDRTTLYAKWTPASTANYTVIIWKQNVAADGYDFGESISLSGNTGDVVNAVAQQGTGDNAYARVNGDDKQYEGFHLRDFDQNVVITPEGDAIVSIYYNRTEYTLRFFYARSYNVTSGATTSYEYVPVATTNNQGQITWNNGYSYSNSETYYRNTNGNVAYFNNNRFYQDRNWQGNYTNRINNGTIYIRQEVTTGGTTQAYVQVNCNNEGFLRGIANNRNLNQSLTYRGSNDYQLLDGSNTWKDVNNASVGGNPLNLVSEAYLEKPEVTAGSVQINGVTTDVVTGNNASSVKSVNMTYYYLDVKVRYEQDLTDLWPEPTMAFNEQAMTTFNRSNGNYSTISPRLQGSWKTGKNLGGTYSVLDMGLFEGEETTAYLLTYWRYEPFYTYQYNVYFSALDGETATTQYKGKGYVLQNDLSYTVANGQGWADSGAPTDDGRGYWDVGTVTFNGANVVGRVDVNNGTINVYYDRVVNNIVYNDGIYVDGDGNPIQNKKNQQLNTKSVTFGADLSSYNEGGSNYWRPNDTEEYVFEGWYLDTEGTQPYSFTGTMPQEDIKIYAKWRQVQYRVFLHPNADNDESLDWGVGSQQMNFRVNYDGTISAPNGRRTEYEFVGWYTDPSRTAQYLFNAETRLNKDTVTAEYNKETDMTDVMNKFGEITDSSSAYNSDLRNNRTWVTKRFDLYGKWRAKIVGALGIGVTYDLNGGSGNIEDKNLYLDQAEATAQAAATAPEGKQFVKWVVQTWDQAQGKYVDTNISVYPGDSFYVLKSDAKQLVSVWVNPNDENDTYGVDNPQPGATPPDSTHTAIKAATYTVQLRAEYVDTGNATPTFLNWYGNNETEKASPDSNFVVEDKPIAINQAIDVKPPTTFTYPGHTFLGWARVATTNDNGTPLDTPLEDQLDGKTLNLTEDDLFLKWVADSSETGGGHYVATSKTVGASNGTTVSKVAADEDSPYHAMVAVWAPKTYPVTIKKVVVGSTSDEAASYTIGYEYNTTKGSVSLKHNETQTLTTQVPYGTVFTVSESGYNDFDKAYSAAQTKNSEGVANDPEVAIQPEAETDATFKITGDTTITVTNTRKGLDLSFKKVLSDSQVTGDAKPAVTSIVFTLKNNDDPTKTYTASPTSDGIVEFKTIPIGEYTLIESNAPAGYAAVSNHVVEVTAETYTIKLDGTEIAKDSDGYVITDPLGTANVTLKKVDDKNNQLANAKFTLNKWKGTGTTFEKVSDYTVGEQDMTGLSVGIRYQLVENDAPAGYIVLSDAFYFQIKLDGTVELTNAEGVVQQTVDKVVLSGNAQDGYTITVKNTPGKELPSTGGSGTWGLTLLGLALAVVGAGILVGRRGSALRTLGQRGGCGE